MPAEAKDSKSQKVDIAEEGANKLNAALGLSIITAGLTTSHEDETVRTPDQPTKTADLKALAAKLTPISHRKRDIHDRTVARRNRARENGMSYAQAEAISGAAAASAVAAEVECASSGRSGRGAERSGPRWICIG